MGIIKRDRATSSTSEISYHLDPDGNESIAATSYAGKGSNSDHYGTPDPRASAAITIQGQNAVRFSKVLVFFVLFLAAGAVAAVTYFLIISEEQTEFKSQFAGFASEVVTVSRQKADQMFASMDALSVSIASSALATNSSWPFVRVPNWSLKMETFAPLIGGKSPIIAFAPIVEEYQRGMWSGYSMQEAPKYYEESITASKTNDTVEGFMNGTMPFIHNYDVQNNFRPTPVTGPTPSFPAWQTHPLVMSFTGVMHTNLDIHAWPQIATLIHISNATRRTSIDFNTDVREASNSIIQPVFEGVDLKSEDSKMVGVIWLSMQWSNYFQDLLVEGVDGIVIVVRSSCSRVKFDYLDPSANNNDGQPSETVASYLINGPTAEYLGDFDAHDSKYDKLGVTKVLVDLNVDPSKIPDGDCIPTLTLHLYPTEDFEARYLSDKAIYYTVAVLLIFGFTSMVFILYDFFVGRRQRTVMDRILRQDKIVSNVFPTAIRERLYDGHKSSSGDDFLGPLDFDGNASDAPLADLFPNTTVMFADIAGFTAWSSAREPSQVFILLETIYAAFDKLAYRYGVFKVETVGDSYVAVGGLPEPNDDHAIIVARFARGCMKKMKDVTAKLEVTLGPDTSDLKLRIGINSGQVTAGVLRGERTRFQLFGDTVNTAARMESSGMAQHIQVSQTTADLLTNAGWSRYIRARSHKIHVKGKGEMQTYWLLHNSEQSNDKNSEASDTIDTEHSSSNHDDDGDENIVETTKQERLVEWTVEILSSLLQQVMASRSDSATDSRSVSLKEQMIGKDNKKVLDEFVPIISLKRFDSNQLKERQRDSLRSSIGKEANSQLRDYLSHVASMYRNNPFHNFEHATHVTASVKKLLMRIVDTDKRNALLRQESVESMELTDLAGHSYGITSDPLTQFAVAFSAIIHDLDHPGVPNTQLVKEETRTAKMYQKSIAEQNSVDLAWELLMGPEYEALRRCIYQTEEELCRFRQLVVNTVLATDIVDKGLQELRKARWETAFADTELGASRESFIESEDRKATIVIEHLIQASDVSHTMQHWHIYKQWNEKFFMECYGAYKAGRADMDPSINWYKGEIGFFDFYVIPLAKKLDSCGVFGVSSHEYLNYAMANREEWVREGEKLVAEYRERYETMSAIGKQ